MPKLTIELPYTPEGENAAEAIAKMARQAGGDVKVADSERDKGARQMEQGARANRPPGLAGPMVGPPRPPMGAPGPGGPMPPRPGM